MECSKWAVFSDPVTYYSLRFQPAARPNLLKNIPSNTGRASAVKNDIVSK